MNKKMFNFFKNVQINVKKIINFIMVKNLIYIFENKYKCMLYSEKDI